MSLRDQILQASDKRLKEVEAFGVKVFVKNWSGVERAKVQAMERTPDMVVRVFALSVCDEQGKPLFTDADVAALSEKDGAELEKVTLAALDHNGVSKAKVEEAKN